MKLIFISVKQKLDFIKIIFIDVVNTLYVRQISKCVRSKINFFITRGYLMRLWEKPDWNGHVLDGTCPLAPQCAWNVYLELRSQVAGYFQRVTHSQSLILFCAISTKCYCLTCFNKNNNCKNWYNLIA